MDLMGLTFWTHVTQTYKLGTLVLMLYGPILIGKMNSQYKGLNMTSKKEGYVIKTKGSYVQLYISKYRSINRTEKLYGKMNFDLKV